MPNPNNNETYISLSSFIIVSFFFFLSWVPFMFGQNRCLPNLLEQNRTKNFDLHAQTALNTNTSDEYALNILDKINGLRENLDFLNSSITNHTLQPVVSSPVISDLAEKIYYNQIALNSSIDHLSSLIESTIFENAEKEIKNTEEKTKVETLVNEFSRQWSKEMSQIRHILNISVVQSSYLHSLGFVARGLLQKIAVINSNTAMVQTLASRIDELSIVVAAASNTKSSCYNKTVYLQSPDNEQPHLCLNKTTVMQLVRSEVNTTVFKIVENINMTVSNKSSAQFQHTNDRGSDDDNVAMSKEKCSLKCFNYSTIPTIQPSLLSQPLSSDNNDNEQQPQSTRCNFDIKILPVEHGHCLINNIVTTNSNSSIRGDNDYTNSSSSSRLRENGDDDKFSTRINQRRYHHHVSPSLDYALETAGGSIVPALTSPTAFLLSSSSSSGNSHENDKNSWFDVGILSLLQKLRRYLHGMLKIADIIGDTPRVAITVADPSGNNKARPAKSCWHMQGSSGNLTVRLAIPIQVKSVSIEHISSKHAANINVAPKLFQVYGLTENNINVTDNDNDGSIFTERLLLTGHYNITPSHSRRHQYLNIDDTNNDDDDDEYTDDTDDDDFPYHHQQYNRIVQTFSIQNNDTTTNATNGDNNVYSVVKLRILSNHGNDTCTCIYRFRVHGSPL